MFNKTAKIVNPDRVREILLAYGATIERWPDEERSAAISLIKNSEQLTQLLSDAQRLDQAMNLTKVNPVLFTRPKAELVAQLVGALPQQNKESVRDHDSEITAKLPNHRLHWFKYAVAASITFVIISFVPLMLKSPDLNKVASQNDLLDQWMWQEISEPYLGESIEPLSFMAFVDLDIISEED